MRFIETPIKDLLLIEPKVWHDDRGYFFESFNAGLFSKEGIKADFIQDNQSLSQKGALRGLHAQAPPHAQGKLVRVISGRVWDVAVDMRRDSATFGQYFGMELSGENHLQLWIPPGFLHGFLTLEDKTIFHYKVTTFYNKASEVGLRWDDTFLNIQWPVLEDGSPLICSEKDLLLPAFDKFENPF